VRYRTRRRLAIVAVFVVFAMIAAFVIATLGGNTR
jgi:hypothetical protein